MDASSPNLPDLPTKRIWPFFVIGLIFILLFVGLNAWLSGSANTDVDPEEAARSEERVKNLASVREENQKKLHEYAWVDRAKGTVQIPVDRAMELVISELNTGIEPRPAYPIVQPTTPAPTPVAPAPPLP